MADHTAIPKPPPTDALWHALRDERILLVERLRVIASWWTETGTALPDDCREDVMGLFTAMLNMVFTVRRFDPGADEPQPSSQRVGLGAVEARDPGDTKSATADEADDAAVAAPEGARNTARDELPRGTQERIPDQESVVPNPSSTSDSDEVPRADTTPATKSPQTDDTTLGHSARLEQELGRIWADTMGNAAPYLSRYGAMADQGPEAQWLALNLVGLRLSPDHPLHAELTGLRAAPWFDEVWGARCQPVVTVPGQSDLDLSGVLDDPDDDFLRETLREMLWLVEHDAGLHIAVEQLTKGWDTTYVPITDEHREQYRTTAGRRYDTHREAQERDRAWTMTKLDELVRGVLPLPLPQRGSWWDTKLQTLGTMLAAVNPQAAFDPVGQTYEAGELWNSKTQVAVHAKALDGIRATDGQGPSSGETLWVLRYPCARENGLARGRIMYVC